MRFLISTVLFLSLVATTSVHGDEFTDAIGAAAMQQFALKVKSVRILERTERTVLKEIILENKRTGLITLYKRDPANSMLAQWPTAFVLSGLGTARDTVNLIPESELEASFVVFSYPFDRAPKKPEEIGEFAKSIPLSVLQIAAAFLWLEQQADVGSRIVSLNVSYGTFFAPLAFRLLAQIKHYPAQTIFAFGGADLEPFIQEYVDSNDGKRVLTDAVRSLNSKSTYKHLRGPFLVVDGTNDKVIPRESADSLFNYLPEPKTRVSLDTDHIGTRKPEVVSQMLATCLQWLEQF